MKTPIWAVPLVILLMVLMFSGWRATLSLNEGFTAVEPVAVNAVPSPSVTPDFVKMDVPQTPSDDYPVVLYRDRGFQGPSIRLKVPVNLHGSALGFPRPGPNDVDAVRFRSVQFLPGATFRVQFQKIVGADESLTVDATGDLPRESVVMNYGDRIITTEEVKAPTVAPLLEQELPGFTRFPNRENLGENATQLDNMTPGNCAIFCNGLPSCVGFTHTSTSTAPGTCYIKKTSGDMFDPRAPPHNYNMSWYQRTGSMSAPLGPEPNAVVAPPMAAKSALHTLPLSEGAHMVAMWANGTFHTAGPLANYPVIEHAMRVDKTVYGSKLLKEYTTVAPVQRYELDSHWQQDGSGSDEFLVSVVFYVNNVEVQRETLRSNNEADNVPFLRSGTFKTEPGARVRVVLYMENINSNDAIYVMANSVLRVGDDRA